MYDFKKQIGIVQNVNEYNTDDAVIVIAQEESEIDEMIYILECIKLSREKLKDEQSKDNFEALLTTYSMIGSQSDRWIQILLDLSYNEINVKKAA
jgi:hypothetical protein